MRFILIPAILAASPALAHEASVAHAHNAWALPAGLGLIALAAAAATVRARVRVRK